MFEGVLFIAQNKANYCNDTVHSRKSSELMKWKNAQKTTDCLKSRLKLKWNGNWILKSSSSFETSGCRSLVDSGLSLDWARPSATRVCLCKHWKESISTQVQQPIDGVGQEDAHEHWRSSGHLLRNDVLRRLPGGHREAFEAGPQSNTGVTIVSIQLHRKPFISLE